MSCAGRRGWAWEFLLVHRTLFSKCRGVLRTDLRAGSQSENVKIVSTLNDLKRTVESRPKTAHSVAAVVCGVFIYMLISGWVGNMWNSQSVLAMRYSVPTEKVIIEEMPHDCDFLRAPLGVKGCSYTRETSVVKTGVNAAGQHVVTYDNGKSWSPIDDPSQIQTGVFVMWKK